jgi:hypothetical protein
VSGRSSARSPDTAQNKVTVRRADGTVHEFQASADAIKGF